VVPGGRWTGGCCTAGDPDDLGGGIIRRSSIHASLSAEIRFGVFFWILQVAGSGPYGARGRLRTAVTFPRPSSAREANQRPPLTEPTEASTAAPGRIAGTTREAAMAAFAKSWQRE
jgi:hypothetical protein